MDQKDGDHQRRLESARRYREQHRRERSEYGQRYREEHREQRAEYARQYREDHADEIAAYRRHWREEHLDEARTANRENMRRKAAEERNARERRVKKAANARERYHSDIEASRAKGRERRAHQRAADPDGYRESKRRHKAAWRERHKDEINERVREKNLRDPSRKKVQAQRYYQRHAEERRAYRRQYYQENREEQLAKQKQWRDRERRRIEAGLPVRRLHTVTPVERDQNAAAAAAFFARPITAQLEDQLKVELATPQHLIDAWRRQCARIRAADYARRHPETTSDTVQRRTAEEARLDTIARSINERLRLTPHRDARPAADPAYQFSPPVESGGLGL